MLLTNVPFNQPNKQRQDTVSFVSEKETHSKILD